jgi:hypothetical protein
MKAHLRPPRTTWRRHRPLALLVFTLLSISVSAQRRLDTTTFIVLGEGLAAGMADFALREVYQQQSFPAQMARQMKVLFPQPLIESPGIGSAPGFTALPPRLPGTLQGSVRRPFPPYLFVFNLSVPGLRLADSLNLRPSPPLIHQHDSRQTVINFILGYPALVAGEALPLWTQAEYAVKLRPTFAVVALGYYDVLEPAVLDDPSLLPDAGAFRSNFERLLSGLKQSFPELLVLTIPDPFDTAYFTPLAAATRLVGAEPETLIARYRLLPDDYLTPQGLMLLGNFTLGNVVIDDPDFHHLGDRYPGTVVGAATRSAVTAQVAVLNRELRSAAERSGAIVYDLHGLFQRLRNDGLWVGTRHLTAEYLGGLYSLNGYYPGTTGHAVIANELLQVLNQTFRTSYPAIELAQVSSEDPAVRFRPGIQRGNRPVVPRRGPQRNTP